MRYLNNDLFQLCLIEDAKFDGKYEMPVVGNTVKAPPKDIVPFEKWSIPTFLYGWWKSKSISKQS